MRQHLGLPLETTLRVLPVYSEMPLATALATRNMTSDVYVPWRGACGAEQQRQRKLQVDKWQQQQQTSVAGHKSTLTARDSGSGDAQKGAKRRSVAHVLDDDEEEEEEAAAVAATAAGSA